MLTNNQFRYISYGIMIFIVLILISNIYITKINNNYTSSGLIEGFSLSGSNNDSSFNAAKASVDKDLHIQDTLKWYCDPKTQSQIKDYTKAFQEDIPKLLGISTLNLINGYYEMSMLKNYDDKIKTKPNLDWAKANIDYLNTINDNFKYLNSECSQSLFSGGGSSNNNSSNNNSSNKLSGLL